MPDSCAVALVLVDVINDLDFPDNGYLLEHSAKLADSIAELKRRCKAARVPCFYVNDNRGRWRSDFRSVIEHCMQPQMAGRTMTERLLPEADDYLVLKPKHSAFFSTPLDTLLAYSQVQTVILAGLTTNACVLMTASDVYIRDLGLFVPRDCVAACDEQQHRIALELMQANLRADIRPAAELDLARLRRPDQI